MAKTGRNDPCPCGSGKKYKRCCGALTPGQPLADPFSQSAPPRNPRQDVSTGLRYLMGRNTPPDPARGIALIEQAAQAGDTQGAWLAATIASSSFWRTRDWDKALNYLMRSAQGKHGPSESSLRVLAGGPKGNGAEGDDWEKIRGAVDLPAWLAPPATRTIHEEPCIQVIEKFAPPAACDWLMARAEGRLARATIYDKATGGKTEDERRTNFQCNLDFEICGVLTFVLRARIAAMIGREDMALEIPKILYYAPGDTFENHFDFLDPAEPAYANELAARGQRTHTFLIYLNEGYSGGETCFTKLGISHAGATGDALLFSNVDAAGMPDYKTMHAGLPPTSGDKWIFSQWVREFPKE